MAPQRQDLLRAASALCEDFASASPPEKLLSHFSRNPTAIEHGLPALAPFLGREFTGRDGVGAYFNLLVEHLKFENMKFSEYVVDTEVLKVGVKGTARFISNKTEQAWDEVFSYVLDFVEEDGEPKLQRYQVWADSGAAYLASKGELERVEKGA